MEQIWQLHLHCETQASKVSFGLVNEIMTGALFCEESPVGETSEMSVFSPELVTVVSLSKLESES